MNSESKQSNPYIKIVVLTVVAIFAGGLFYFFGDKLSLEYLAGREQQLRDFQQQNSVIVYGAAFLVYVTVTGLSLPGATILTLLYGWYFGLTSGLVLVSFASTSGATLAFLLSRYLLRETIQNKFGDKLKAFNKNLEREGAFYLFTLRLIPAVPFFVINAVMGLTPMKVWTFWWVSQLGMLAGTVVYVYAGSSVPGLQQLADEGVKAVFSANQLTQLFVAFAVLGFFPLAVKQIMKLVRDKPIEQAQATAE